MPRSRLACVAVTLGVLVWGGSAAAVNALVSQDLPVLIEIAATEAASYTELGAILAQSTALVKQVKEYTTIAKTAWGAIDELRHLTSDDLALAARAGLDGAFPELGILYRDARDISDFDYRNYKAFEALRGILWAEVYGPAIDQLHAGHERLDRAAGMREHEMRHVAKVYARRLEAQRWEEDCRRTGADGVEGACRAAANRAAIQQAILLADIHETSLHSMAAQRVRMEREDRLLLDRRYAFARWMFDLEQFLVNVSGDPDGLCVAGECVYEQYAGEMQRRVSEYRERHPKQFEYLLDSSLAED